MTIEAWQVELPSGDILTVSLDDLDAAFADGHVTEATRIRRVGDPTWTTLALAAGLDAAKAPKSAAPRVDPFVVPTPAIPIAPSSMAPLALDLDDELPFAPKRRPVGVVLGICAACAALILSAGVVSAVSAQPKLASAATTSALTAAHGADAPHPAAPPPAPMPAAAETTTPPAPHAAPEPAHAVAKGSRPAVLGKVPTKSPAKKPAAKPTKPAKGKRPF
jgi:hypothetical protein